MVFRLLAEDEEVPHLNSHKRMEKYCEPIIKKLLDPQICNDLFKRATEIIDGSEMDLSDKQHFKQAAMVDKLLEKYKEMAKV